VVEQQFGGFKGQRSEREEEIKEELKTGEENEETDMIQEQEQERELNSNQ